MAKGNPLRLARCLGPMHSQVLLLSRTLRVYTQLSSQHALLASQVHTSEGAAAVSAEALEATQAKEAVLLQQRNELDRELLASKRREEQLHKKVGSTHNTHSTV